MRNCDAAPAHVARPRRTGAAHERNARPFVASAREYQMRCVEHTRNTMLRKGKDCGWHKLERVRIRMVGVE